MGVIGLDYGAVIGVADKIGIDIDELTFRLLSAMSREVLSGKDDDKIIDYCAACADLQRNTNCFECVLKFDKGG